MLIPKVMEKWKALGASILSRTICIVDLENAFSSISALTIKEELQLLSLNDFSGTDLEGADKKVMLSEAISDMNKFVFLRKLRKWIPSLLRLHDLLGSLCLTDRTNDMLSLKFDSIIGNIQSSWPIQSLKSISALCTDLDDLFQDYPSNLLNFMSCLGNSPDVSAWLLTQNSTEEFNRLLQVVRPCTDEPRLLSAIASLVHIRTLLLQPLYLMPPYEDLDALLKGFKCIDVGSPESGYDSEGLYHLSNVSSCFDGLMDVFQRQTVSPGIKACYNLNELKERGQFVLTASEDPSKVLHVNIFNSKKPAAEDGLIKLAADSLPAEDFRSESIEYMLDLRSKLLMTEIPPEVEDQLNASALIESFVQQFQLLCEMRDTLVKLHHSGHILFQDSYERTFLFSMDGTDLLQIEYDKLLEELRMWRFQVKTACVKYYFLNFFTMREVLRLRKLVLEECRVKDTSKPVDETTQSVAAKSGMLDVLPPPPPIEAVQDSEPLQPEFPDIDAMMSMGFSKEHCVAALRRCSGDVSAAIEFVLSNMQYMDRIVLEEQETAEMKMGRTEKPIAADNLVDVNDEISPFDEILGLLHLISSHISADAVKFFIFEWNDSLNQNDPADSTSFLLTLGSILGQIFGTDRELERASAGRHLSLPSSSALNRADTLVNVGSKSCENNMDDSSIGATFLAEDEKTKRIPVFITCTESPEYVIDTTLSVYVRRGRMPEPGEVIFCTVDTTMEDLNLLLMRFIFARSNGRGGSVFTIADLHKLSYASQCSFVESLRSYLRDYGQDSAATLLLVSGLPRQVC